MSPIAITIISYIIIIPLIILVVREAWYQLRKNNFERKLIDKYEHDVNNPELIDIMYDYVSHDRKLKKIVERHEATRADFKMIYKKLLVHGNFRKINRFVPINAFFSVKSLEYVLEHKNEDEFVIVKKVLNFFHI